MSLLESGESTGEVSLAHLFEEPDDIEGVTSGDVETVAEQICGRVREQP